MFGIGRENDKKVMEGMKDIEVNDQTIRDMYKRMFKAKDEIQKRRIKLAKERGFVFDSLDDAVCEHHSGVKFEEWQTIPGSTTTSIMADMGIEGLKVYLCSECIPDKKAFPKTTYYECPTCGVVLGSPDEKPFGQVGPSGHAISSSGMDYSCRICDSRLGHQESIHMD